MKTRFACRLFLSAATLASLKTEPIGQRLLGNFGFADVQRGFDGLQ